MFKQVVTTDDNLNWAGVRIDPRNSNRRMTRRVKKLLGELNLSNPPPANRTLGYKVYNGTSKQPRVDASRRLLASTRLG